MMFILVFILGFILGVVAGLYAYYHVLLCEYEDEYQSSKWDFYHEDKGLRHYYASKKK